MIEKRTGGCHCKAVRYEVNIDLTKPVIECNCSYCSVKGLLLSAVMEDDVKVLSGEDNLTEYRFNTEKIRHLFCKTCGVESFGQGSGKDGSPMRMVNVRTIDDIDLAALTRMPFDGKSR
jgi:hypothetical protein